MNIRKRFHRAAVTAAILTLTASPAWAGFADVPGKGVFVGDVSLQNPVVRSRYNDRGDRNNLVDDMVMYDPSGNALGTISVPARHSKEVLLHQFAYGITDKLAVAVIVPYFLSQRTELNFGWAPGAYAAELGRSYSESDFWQFAESMGQQKPQDHEDRGILGDIILAGLYNVVKGARHQISILAIASTHTGSQADPNILGATGTTGFDLQSNGDLGAHLLGDYRLHDRLSVGGEVYYHHFFPRSMPAAMGEMHPLMAFEGLYAGESYTLDPGEWIGTTAGLELTIFRGTDSPSWITRKNPEMQKTLPKLFNVNPGIRYLSFFGNRYESESPFFDHDRAGRQPGGYRVTVLTKATMNFIRYGVPLAVYYQYMNQELISGTNFIPAVNNIFGVQLFAAF
jgi:hypothetical protein